MRCNSQVSPVNLWCNHSRFTIICLSPYYCPVLFAMITVNASHYSGSWYSHSDQPIQIPNMNRSGLVSSYDFLSRTVIRPPTSISYQTTSSQLEINISLISTYTMTTSMPHQSGVFAFNSLPVNPYSMQQAFPMSYLLIVPRLMSKLRASRRQRYRFCYQC